MKTIFFLIISLGAGLILDLFLASFGGSIIVSLIIAVACYWFWRLTFTGRLFLAFAVGLLLDVTGFLPMGSYMLILIVMAYLCELIKDFFSNNESRTVIALNMAILIITFRLLIVPASLLTTFAASFV